MFLKFAINCIRILQGELFYDTYKYFIGVVKKKDVLGKLVKGKLWVNEIFFTRNNES